LKYIDEHPEELEKHCLSHEELLENLFSCRNKSMELIKQIQIKYNIAIPTKEKNLIFERSCNYDERTKIEYLYELGIEQKTIYECFKMSCCRGKLDLAKRLREMGNISIKDDENQVFRQTCMAPENDYDSLLEYADESQIQYLQTNTTLNVLKWLVEQGATIDHQALVACCQSMDIKKLDWILSFGTLDIHGNGDEAFRKCFIPFMDDFAPYNPEMWKKIYAMGNVNIFANDHALFKEICTTSIYTDATEWLINESKGRYSVKTKNEDIINPPYQQYTLTYVAEYTIDGVSHNVPAKL